jgi:hypothetical protein
VMSRAPWNPFPPIGATMSSSCPLDRRISRKSHNKGVAETGTRPLRLRLTRRERTPEAKVRLNLETRSTRNQAIGEFPWPTGPERLWPFLGDRCCNSTVRRGREEMPKQRN